MIEHKQIYANLFSNFSTNSAVILLFVRYRIFGLVLQCAMLISVSFVLHKLCPITHRTNPILVSLITSHTFLLMILYIMQVCKYFITCSESTTVLEWVCKCFPCVLALDLTS